MFVLENEIQILLDQEPATSDKRPEASNKAHGIWQKYVYESENGLGNTIVEING